MATTEAPPSPPALPRLDLRGADGPEAARRLESWAADFTRTVENEFARILARQAALEARVTAVERVTAVGAVLP